MSCSREQKIDLVRGEKSISGDQCQALHARLRDHDTVEGIAMMQRQHARFDAVGGRDRQLVKVLLPQCREERLA